MGKKVTIALLSHRTYRSLVTVMMTKVSATWLHINITQINIDAFHGPNHRGIFMKLQYGAQATPAGIYNVTQNSNNSERAAKLTSSNEVNSLI